MQSHSKTRPEKKRAHARDLKQWLKLLRRFHPHLIAVVARELKRRSGGLGLARLETLLAQIYLELFAQRGKVLEMFQNRSEEAVVKYLEIVAIRIVLKSTGLRPSPGKAHALPPADDF